MQAHEFRRFRRQSLDMTQQELALELGLTVKTIGNYEKGRQPVPRLVSLAIQELRTIKNHTAPPEEA